MKTKHKILLIAAAMFILPQLLEAQTDSTGVWRFVYDFKDVNYGDGTSGDRMNLDVQPDGSSLFYSQYASDGGVMETDGKSVDEIIAELDKSKHGAAFKIYRNGLDGKMVFATTVPDRFYYEEQSPQPGWTIHDTDTATVCGYACKMAETDFAGRHWTAWFAEDLPLASGPWKLWGLPGLILAASDYDNYFTFTCIGIEQATGGKWAFNPKDFTRCTHDEYQEQFRMQAADPVNYALRKLGLATVGIDDVTVIDDDGGSSDKLPSLDRIYMEREKGDEK